MPRSKLSIVLRMLFVSALCFGPALAQAKRVIYSPAGQTPATIASGTLMCVEIYYAPKEMQILTSKTTDVIQEMQKHCRLTEPYSVSVNDLEVQGCCLRQ